MYAEVIPNFRLPQELEIFDYEVPEDLTQVIQPGFLVNIPFRNRTIEGLVYRIKQHTNVQGKILPIKSAILPFAPFKQRDLNLLDRISEYYFVSKPMVLKAFLPGVPQRKAQYKPIEVPEVNVKLSGIKPILEPGKKPILLIYQDRNLLLENIKHYVEKINGQVIVLEPQIAFVNTTAKYLENFFKNQVVSLHSEFSKTQYWKNWLDFVEGRKKVLVSTRAGIFTPSNNLGTIIINDEDLSDFKQYDQNPRYDARTIALKRDAPLVFATGSPRLVTWDKAKKEKWQIVEMMPTEKPKINIIDIEDERRKYNFSLLSHGLEQACDKALQKGQKVLLFFNRRGWATSIICQDCGFTAMCSNCQLPFIAHGNHLLCHHCGNAQDMILACPECNSTNIKMLGAGTERLELEIKKLFAKYHVLRLDKDVDYKTDHRLADYDIILGTNLILKDYYWQITSDLGVGVVGVINADNLFNIPDFRSTERAWQEIRKIKNLSSKIQAELFVQTRRPQNKVLKNLTDIEAFFEDELKARKSFNYPPFQRLIKIVIQHTDPDVAQKKARIASQKLEAMIKELDAEAMGPYGATPIKIRNNYRYLITLKISPKENINFLKNLLDGIIIDVDPEYILT